MRIYIPIEKYIERTKVVDYICIDDIIGIQAIIDQNGDESKKECKVQVKGIGEIIAIGSKENLIEFIIGTIPDDVEFYRMSKDNEQGDQRE